MAAVPALDPTVAQEDQQQENDEGEESDDYDIEPEGEEGVIYDPEEDDDDDDEEGDEEDGGAGDAEPESMTALLLGEQNGTNAEVYDEDDDEEDDEYREDKEGTAENSSVFAGSKRGVDELSEGDAFGNQDDEVEAEGENLAKKARV